MGLKKNDGGVNLRRLLRSRRLGAVTPEVAVDVESIIPDTL